MPGDAWMGVESQFNRSTGYRVNQFDRGFNSPDSVFVLLTKSSLTSEGFIIWTSLPTDYKGIKD